MIKENKNDKRPYFHPTFGSRPAQIVGRDREIEEFLEGLDAPVGSHERCTFFIGQRGMGKTALLLELAERAQEKDYVVALVTAYEEMENDIIEVIQRNGSKVLPKEKKRIQGVEAGAFGFSFGLTFSEATQVQYGFRSKLTLLCDKLEEYGKGVLILVDEAKTSESMRQLAITYQHLVGEEKNIAMVMAGLPQAVSTVLNDKVLTFLNRAKKVKLDAISLSEIHAYYTKAFKESGIKCTESLLEEAVGSTKGFPYLMQLIGYYILKYVADDCSVTEKILHRARAAAVSDLGNNVFEPILKPLSDMDMEFLEAMAKSEGESKTADIARRLGKSNSYIQPYRARLIDAGIIESPRNGKLNFCVPYLADYIRGAENDK